MHLFEHYCTPLEYIFPQKHCINTKVTIKTHCNGLVVCCQSKEKELSKLSSMSNPETGQQTGTQTTLTPFPCWNLKALRAGLLMNSACRSCRHIELFLLLTAVTAVECDTSEVSIYLPIYLKMLKLMEVHVLQAKAVKLRIH